MPNHKKELILTVGVSASGKSTWAQNHIAEMAELRENSKSVPEWVRIERDLIRASLLNDKTDGLSQGKMRWDLWKKKWEKEVTKIQTSLIESAISVGASVVVSDTNLNPRTRKFLIEKFKENNYQITIRYFPIEYEEAVRRDALRECGVGALVIAEQFAKWDQQFERKYRPDLELPKAVIVDIDGTLAKMSSRSPFDWDRVGEDTVHQHVKDVVVGLSNQGYRVVIVSGRDGCCRDLTENWLNDHKIPFDAFYIRAENDTRKDTIVKEEILFKEIEPRYNVVMAIDDRPSVCRNWEKLGIPVLKCGNQQIFF